MSAISRQPQGEPEEQRAESTTERSAAADPQPTGSDDGSDPLPRDVVFELLSAERRRLLLRYLDENGGRTMLGDVAGVIAAAENDLPVEEITSEQRKRVYVGLYQCHLPKLDDANVIDYDSDRGSVVLLEGAEQLFPHIYLDPTEASADGFLGGLRRAVGKLTDLF